MPATATSTFPSHLSDRELKAQYAARIRTLGGTARIVRMLRAELQARGIHPELVLTNPFV